MSEFKTAVISSIPPRRFNDKPGEAWADLADVTWATMRRYCERHGYDFYGDISDLKARVGSPWIDEPRGTVWAPVRTMIKFPLLLHYLQPEKCGVQYDWVVWMDADCLITNYEMKLEKFYNGMGYCEGESETVGDVIMAKNIDGLHPTVFMVRNTATTLGLIWHCSEAGMRMWQQHDWSDIMAWRFALETPPYQHLVWYHHIQTLCAQHPAAYAMPRRAALGSEWTPPNGPDDGSLTLHLSAMQMKDRIALAKAYAEKLGLLCAINA